MTLFALVSIPTAMRADDRRFAKGVVGVDVRRAGMEST
jgi:hypothetical protein